MIEEIKMVFYIMLSCVGFFWGGILFLAILRLIAFVLIEIPLEILFILFPGKKMKYIF